MSQILYTLCPTFEFVKWHVTITKSCRNKDILSDLVSNWLPAMK